MLEYYDIFICTSKKQVQKHGRCIRLTPLEYHLFLVLLLNLNQPMSRASLLALVWHTEIPLRTRTIDVFVSKLRKKLGLKKKLVAISGVGYLLKE